MWKYKKIINDDDDETLPDMDVIGTLMLYLKLITANH